ncbi:group 1 glycosyl transferase [Nitzschia inconspicua]|uniref:Group 1 glycosyl transferase n=1 Tax=Nitzschia inconspicua TaxID=303405 RepID=A0A9K3PV90_9STRA|nr:group 1 glycosyl transferase [Nitzschia inconspicua]
MHSSPSSSLFTVHQHRILIYTTCYNVLDGVTLTIRKIEQEILAQGYSVCILSTKSGNMKYTHMDGEHPNRTVIFLDNSIPIPFLHDPHNKDNSYHMGFSLSAAVQERIEAFEPTLIHITVPDCTCLHLIQYARTKELPLMGTYHSNIPEYMTHYPGLGWLKHILSAFFKHEYNFLQALYVPTPFIHRHLCQTSQMDQATNLQVWGRGIDLERFSPKHRSQAFRQRYGFTPNDVVLTWVGRLVPEKRPDIFCYVVRRLAQEGIPFRALIVGAGPCEEEVKTLPNTTFAGWMSGDDLATAYASSDVFLFPSAVETFGNVTLEAAASGLPLVVEAGCSGHLVNHGVNGFACQDGDVEAYYSSTLCLVLDSVCRNSMSEEGRKFSMQFEKRVVCQRMIENYSRVTDEFYSVYGGHHANRDQVYSRKEKSFHAGNTPRPIMLKAVEGLFVLIFCVMYYMASFFVTMRERMFSAVGISDHHTIAAATPKKQAISSPSMGATTTLESHASSDSSTLPLVLDSIVEVEEGFDSEDGSTDSVSSRQRRRQQQLSRLHMSPAKPMDSGLSIMTGVDELENESCHAPASPVSLDDDQSSSSRSSSKKSLCSRPNLPISHLMAIGFVEAMAFQFRMECRIRKGLAYILSPSNWNLKRKRKNSGDFLLDDSGMLDLQRRESRERSSGSDLSIEDRELIISSINPRDERLNLRRGNSHLMVDVIV